MADLTLTAAQVLKESGSVDSSNLAGVTITAGQPVYLDSTTGRWLLAFADGADTAVGIAQAAASGIALHAALAGQPLTVLLEGVLAIGATVVKGGIYVVSVNDGMIAPYADLATNHYVTILGVAPDTTRLRVKINATGIRHA